jgi:hypothetical protein
MTDKRNSPGLEMPVKNLQNYVHPARAVQPTIIIFVH